MALPQMFLAALCSVSLVVGSLSQVTCNGCTLEDEEGPSTNPPADFTVSPKANHGNGGCDLQPDQTTCMATACKVHADVTVENVTNPGVTVWARWGTTGGWTVINSGAQAIIAVGSEDLDCNFESDVEKRLHVVTSDPTGGGPPPADAGWLDFVCKKCVKKP